MSWECPYMGGDGRKIYCTRLERDCDPAQKGCVLYGKVRLAAPPERKPPPPPEERER